MNLIKRKLEIENRLAEIRASSESLEDNEHCKRKRD